MRAVGAALYTAGPTAYECQLLLLTEEEASGGPCEVWPDCWDAILVFEAMASQWRIGQAGPTGLDYSVLPFVMRMKKIPRSEWPGIFDDIQVLEQSALKTLRERIDG